MSQLLKTPQGLLQIRLDTKRCLVVHNRQRTLTPSLVKITAVVEGGSKIGSKPDRFRIVTECQIEIPKVVMRDASVEMQHGIARSQCYGALEIYECRLRVFRHEIN